MAVPDAPPPYAAVAFDCDSTLSAVEGIDLLASGLAPAAYAEFRALTEAAMNGELALEEVYARRLELARPSRADLERVGREYVAAAQPHGRELVAALRALGKRVAIVSGGLEQPVRVLAAALGVPAEDVFAVPVRHAPDGSYAGFDPEAPLARAGGKPLVLRALGADVALVGDGATDLEAAGTVARFVAYAGVARRASVLEAAAVRCETADLAALAPLLLAADELEELRASGAHATLLEAAARHADV